MDLPRTIHEPCMHRPCTLHAASSSGCTGQGGGRGAPSRSPDRTPGMFDRLQQDEEMEAAAAASTPVLYLSMARRPVTATVILTWSWP